MALLICAYSLQQGVEMLLRSTGMIERHGRLGLVVSPASLGQWPALTVSKITPGGAADQAGIRAGDRIVFDDPATTGRLGSLTVGETIGLQVLRDKPQALSLKVQPRPPMKEKAQRDRLLYLQSVMLPGLMGVLVLLRARNTRANLLLGASLGCFAIPAYAPQVSTAAAAIFPFFNALGWAMSAGSSLLFPAFAITLIEETSGHRRPWSWRLLAAWAAVELVGFGLAAPMITLGVTLPIIGDGNGLSGLIVIPAYLASMVLLGRSLHQFDANTRRRYWLLIAAVGSVLAALILNLVTFTVLGQGYDSPLQQVANILSGPVAVALFAYAIFRQRVVDLGFAINRTLVYGLTSGALLIAFGLLEWAVENVIKVKGAEENVLIEAGLALGLFLVFHRLHDTIEHLVEKLFFRAWHARAEALRRFVHEAHYIEDGDRLRERAAMAVSLFAQGASARVYDAVEGGGYRSSDRTGDATVLDQDDPIAVAIRATLAPVRTSGRQTALDAALALPFLDRNRAPGFVAVGPKPDGDDFRPDEVEALSQAAISFGNDLRAAEAIRLRDLLANQNAVIEHQQRRLEALAGQVPRRLKASSAV